MTELQINLYEAFLPSEVVLKVRSKPDKLLDGELLLGSLADNISVAVKPGLEVENATHESFLAHDLNPGLMLRLLTEGLATSFTARKLVVEREKLSFNVFDAKDQVKTEFDFIELVRGISFRAEHLTIQNKSHYAFYASMRVRRRFSAQVDSDKLHAAAVGEEVRIIDGERSERAKLIRIVGKLADVETQDFEAKQVALKDIQIGASPSILSRYSHAIGHPEFNSQILIASQVASFRYNASGARVRSWLRAEVNYVGSWLAKTSQGGRLSFFIPNSPSECYVGIKPATSREMTR